MTGPGGWEKGGCMSGTAASAKVWRRIGSHARDALLKSLAPLELRAILADVARSRAFVQTPADLIKRWREDRDKTIGE